jgi:hypothetical protein
LRYVAHCKAPQNRLKTFVKNMGGINACAGLYAKYVGRSARREVGNPKRVSR